MRQQQAAKRPSGQIELCHNSSTSKSRNRSRTRTRTDLAFDPIQQQLPSLRSASARNWPLKSFMHFVCAACCCSNWFPTPLSLSLSHLALSVSFFPSTTLCRRLAVRTLVLGVGCSRHHKILLLEIKFLCVVHLAALLLRTSRRLPQSNWPNAGKEVINFNGQAKNLSL